MGQITEKKYSNKNKSCPVAETVFIFILHFYIFIIFKLNVKFRITEDKKK